MELIWQASPAFVLATNTFISVPIVLQYEDLPLIEIDNSEGAGFTTRFPVYMRDGTKIAVVKGSQMYLTEEGSKAKLIARHEPNLTAFELEGETILELRREGAAALRGIAELWTPKGVLVKVNNEVSGMLRSNEPLTFGGVRMKDMTIKGARIGIHVHDGVIDIGIP